MATKDNQDVPTLPAVQEPADASASGKEGRYAGIVFKDRYLLEQRFGAGGIGEVYLARDQQLHSKPVIIKVLLEESGKDEWFKKKFRQEIEALARIDHPGVVGVLDAGDTPDAKPFLVMQYVKGRELRSMIKYEGMSFDQVATIIRQAAHALSAAHDQGVFHCDLKPENIMLQDLGEEEYQVKIVDFGIAKIKDSQVRTGPRETKVAGTVYYMAPEQIQGNPSAASDVFALSVIAYEMLTGRRPFNPPTPYDMIETVRAGVRLKPCDLRTDLPAQAQEIILKALLFDEGGRYKRARDFGELLAQSLTTDLELPAQAQSMEGEDLEMAHVLFGEVGNPRTPEGIGKKRRSSVAAVVLGLVVLLAAAVTVWMIGGSKAPDKNSASNTNTGGIISPEIERVFSYSLTAVPHINDGKPPRQIVGPEGVSLKDFDVKLNVSAAQSGYLYVLNELPGGENGSPRYQVLYPFLSEIAQGKVSMVTIPDDENQWIPALGKEGTRRFWLVWSDNRVEEIESGEALARAAGGKVEDPGRSKAIQAVLVRYVTAKTLAQRDEVKRQTDVVWKGNTLAYELTLKY